MTQCCVQPAGGSEFCLACAGKGDLFWGMWCFCYDDHISPLNPPVWTLRADLPNKSNIGSNTLCLVSNLAAAGGKKQLNILCFWLRINMRHSRCFDDDDCYLELSPWKKKKKEPSWIKTTLLLLNKRRKPSMAKFISVTSLLQKVSVSPLIDKGGEPRWRHSPSSGMFLKSRSRGEQRREGTALSDPYHNKILTNNFLPTLHPFWQLINM